MHFKIFLAALAIHFSISFAAPLRRARGSILRDSSRSERAATLESTLQPALELRGPEHPSDATVAAAVLDCPTCVPPKKRVPLDATYPPRAASIVLESTQDDAVTVPATVRDCPTCTPPRKKRVPFDATESPGETISRLAEGGDATEPIVLSSCPSCVPPDKRGSFGARQSEPSPSSGQVNDADVNAPVTDGTCPTCDPRGKRDRLELSVSSASAASGSTKNIRAIVPVTTGSCKTCRSSEGRGNPLGGLRKGKRGPTDHIEDMKTSMSSAKPEMRDSGNISPAVRS